MVPFKDFRTLLFAEFSSKLIFDLFLEIFDFYSNDEKSSDLIKKICFVLSDFAAYDGNFIQIAEASSSKVIVFPQSIDRAAVKDTTTLEFVVHVMANLSVSKSCAIVFANHPAIPILFSQCKSLMKESIGHLLLCLSSNISFHNPQWSPPELLSSIPCTLR